MNEEETKIIETLKKINKEKMLIIIDGMGFERNQSEDILNHLESTLDRVATSKVKVFLSGFAEIIK